MRYGRLDRQVTVLRKSIALSPSGAAVETWAPVEPLRRWASMAPVRGDERLIADQVLATEQVEFQLRWATELASLSPLDRIVEPALRLDELAGSPPAVVPEASIAERRQYDVVVVREIGRREGLAVIATRRTDTAVITL